MEYCAADRRAGIGAGKRIDSRALLERRVKSKKVPIPFLLAIMKQESNLKHFRVPSGRDEDNYIVVGLDTNAGKKYIITSRGYGLGQYTLFHHSPRREEVRDFIIDPKGNLQKAISELREKFDHFVIGKSSGTRADDRLVEIGKGPLRVCKYKPGDRRYMKDCAQCLRDAGMRQIRSGVTPFHKGTSRIYARDVTSQAQAARMWSTWTLVPSSGVDPEGP